MSYIFLFVLGIITLYRVVFYYTLFRVQTRAVTENTIGEKFTEVNVINPFKTKSIKEAINKSLKYVSESSDSAYAFIKNEIDYNADYELLDIYEKDGLIYVFTDFKLKKGSSFNVKYSDLDGGTYTKDNFRLLFLLSEDKKVMDIKF